MHVKVIYCDINTTAYDLLSKTIEHVLGQRKDYLTAHIKNAPIPCR